MKLSGFVIRGSDAAPYWRGSSPRIKETFLGRAAGVRQHRTTLTFIGKAYEDVIRSAGENAYDGIGRGEAEFCSSRHFNPESWAQHASSNRYWRELVGLFNGTTTRRVLPIVSFVGLWASLVELYNYFAARNAGVPEFQLPALTFDITAPLIGLLLVFRTNSSYVRYTAGGKAIRLITGHLRDLHRHLLSWTSDGLGRDSLQTKDVRDLIIEYHRWLCTVYLQPGDPTTASVSATINSCLGRSPTSPLTADLIQAAISYKINKLPRLELPQRQGMEFRLSGVTQELAVCEQLLQTPIPLAYTRSLLRFLWLWLTLLPLSLVRAFADFGRGTWWQGQPLFVVPVVACFIAILFLSLDDIAVQLEEPFRAQRFQCKQLSLWFANDAADTEQLIGTMIAADRQVESESSKVDEQHQFT